MTINKNKGQAALKAENALKAAHMRTVRVRMAEGHMNTKKQNGAANTITNRKNALIILNAVAGKSSVRNILREFLMYSALRDTNVPFS